tara:strand:- start:1960 stop:2316 length:357 start_codon:yes stop_codon:yes gene_type:complete
MKSRQIKDVITGSIIATLISVLIIFSIEYDKSFLHILTGFVLFFFPILFISSFISKTGAFIIVTYTTLVLYFLYKLTITDSWIGISLAILLAGSLFYFKILKYQPFSRSKHTNNNKYE